MPTIETCFNCFDNLSSDADKKNLKTTKNPAKFKINANHLDPPPQAGGERGTLQDGASV